MMLSLIISIKLQFQLFHIRSTTVAVTHHAAKLLLLTLPLQWRYCGVAEPCAPEPWHHHFVHGMRLTPSWDRCTFWHHDFSIDSWYHGLTMILIKLCACRCTCARAHSGMAKRTKKSAFYSTSHFGSNKESACTPHSACCRRQHICMAVMNLCPYIDAVPS